MPCIRSYILIIIVFFPTPQRYIPLRNDQDKIADILQERKREYSFCRVVIKSGKNVISKVESQNGEKYFL